MTIRPPERDEYRQIADCFTETRGPNYYSAETYDAAWLESNCELFAAFDDSGALAGVAGLSKGLWDDERTTGCLLTIRPGFTGRGIAKALIGHFAGVLRERAVRSVKGQVVTSNAAVQRIVEGFGWVPTGFLPGARDGRNAVPVAADRRSLVLYTGNIAAKDAGTLYIHKDISAPARRMYGKLGVIADIRDSGGLGETDISHTYDAHNRALYIRAAACGADLTGRLDDLRKQYTDSPPVTVLIDLGVPSAVDGFEALRGAGYRFCGFDPLGRRECAVFYSGEAPGRMDLTADAEAMILEVGST